MLRGQITSHILANLEISKTVFREISDDPIIKNDSKTGELYYVSTLRHYYMDTNKIVSAKKFSKLMSISDKSRKAIGSNSLLLEKGNFTEPSKLQGGKAPKRGNVGYEIHHIIPIALHGSVYGFDNLLITTNICHRKIHKGMRK